MNKQSKSRQEFPRRSFLKASATAGMMVGLGSTSAAAGSTSNQGKQGKSMSNENGFSQTYEDIYLNRVAFPMGGLGAGMVCLEGSGALSHISVRNKPELMNEPCMFAAISTTGENPQARVIEGPVPAWKIFGMRSSGNGRGHSSFGLPRFEQVSFSGQFPFARLSLADEGIPLTVKLTGWSPFTPGDSDSSSLPVAALEYTFKNPTSKPVEAVFSYNSTNFMPRKGRTLSAIRSIKGGFHLFADAPEDRPWEKGSFAIFVDEADVKIDHAWFRGGWFDPYTMVWNHISAGDARENPPVTEGDPPPGASLSIPLKLAPGESRKISIRMCWYCGTTNLRRGPQGLPDNLNDDDDLSAGTYRPWYAGRFRNVEEVAAYWNENYNDLRKRSLLFSETFFDSTLPPEILDAVSANLSILKSPTVLRQDDGRLWAWEGSSADSGCCPGSCTHVWNYAQAIPHLFPDMERSLRETEFGPNQNEDGHQQFRAALPIRPIGPHFHSAADGQLGGIMKVHRDWKISGDSDWLRGLWPKVRKSLDYCIKTWDPKHKGWLEEPHHNTYDIEFWGPDGMCSSFYIGALKAAILMGNSLGEPVEDYVAIMERGTKRIEEELFDGDYFIQKIEWLNLQAKNPVEFLSINKQYSPEAIALFKKEGPKYQYGTGCLSDGVLGSWMALVCGVGQVLDPCKVASHLKSVHKYNLKRDLSLHANPQRPAYALGDEGGLLLCSWPKGGELSLPFVYSNEVWTGIEYQVASHLILMGMVDEGLEIVRICRNRYNGKVRNPYNEYECGNWYARALASYGLLQSLSGANYDAVDKILYLEPSIDGDFQSFLSTETGYGVVGIRKGKPFIEVRSGHIEVREIKYTSKHESV